MRTYAVIVSEGPAVIALVHGDADTAAKIEDLYGYQTELAPVLDFADFCSQPNFTPFGKRAAGA